MKAAITCGQVSDYTGYGDTIDADLPPAKVLIGDKGYDLNAIRANVEDEDGSPVIPARRNRSAPSATGSSGASTGAGTHADAPRTTTRPRPDISPSSKSPPHASGTNICRHEPVHHCHRCPPADFSAHRHCAPAPGSYKIAGFLEWRLP